MPKAIKTKFHGSTTTKPGRISAEDSDGHRVYVTAQTAEAEHPKGSHARAALALCKKMNWTGRLIHGGFKDVEYFVFDQGDNAVETPGESAPVQQWQLMIDHRHGTNATVHTTEEGARKELLDYVWENWDTDGPGRDKDEETSAIPEDAAEAIEAYFDFLTGIESYTLEPATVKP